MVLQIVLIIILERSEFTHIILYLLKSIDCSCYIILIKSVANKNKNKYYSIIFLEKVWYKDKLMFLCYKCYIIIELTFSKECIKRVSYSSLFVFL